MTRRGWLLFATMCVVWGLPYLLIRVAVRELSPAQLVVLRTGGAALLMLPVAARHLAPRRLAAHVKPLLAYALIEVTVPWLLLSHAEQRLTSSVSGLLVAATPLVGVVLARMLGDEDRVDTSRLVGIALGLAGVAALVGIDVGHLDLAAVGLVLVVAVCYASGPFILSRQLADVPGTAVIEVSFVVTAVVCLPLALRHVPSRVGGHTVASVATLTVVCSAVAFLVFLQLIREIGAARATVITYVNPAVAIVLGVAFLGEPLTVGMGVGFPLVLVGSVLATRRAPATAGSNRSGAGDESLTCGPPAPCENLAS